MVFDAKRGRTVVFGGMGTAPEGQRPPTLGDTWEYDGSVWKQIQAAGPSPRMGAGAAYDSRRGRVILFGGMGESGFSGETWSWDGSEWKKLSDTGPAPRGMGYVTYDKARDRVVLFGGRKGWPNGDLADTWSLTARPGNKSELSRSPHRESVWPCRGSPGSERRFSFQPRDHALCVESRGHDRG